MSLEGLIDELNKQLEGIPVGPERDAKLDKLVLGYWRAAKSDRERMFWLAMLSDAARKGMGR